ncbi:MAG: hypothetical protein PUP93_15865 [Rhizonema sp. NSF051]|nr:hypothetical protein [Rhizonema sp. NSF051]
MIGANGAGKSNFLGFFRMIQQLLEQNLQVFVSRQGSPDALLHFGRKTTEQLEFQLYFGNNAYFVTLEPTHDNRLMFTEESFWWNKSGEHEIGRGHFETLALSGTETKNDSHIVPNMQQWRVYHFHDTSNSAYVKQQHGINENFYLRTYARKFDGNLDSELHVTLEIANDGERPYLAITGKLPANSTIKR